MKPLTPSLAQPGQAASPRSITGPLPRWEQLPPARQQELIRLLSSLLLRHWPRPAKEGNDDPQP